jgi:hypothetical protein
MRRRPRNAKASPVAGLAGTGATGLEPATSGVTGRRSNQLSYAPWAESATGGPVADLQYGTGFVERWARLGRHGAG